MTDVKEHQWEYALDNRQPILICDVDFEWLPGDLSKNPELDINEDNEYILKREDGYLTTKKHRFFSASLVNSVINSRLITLSFYEKFVFSNRLDSIRSLSLSYYDKKYFIPVNEKIIVDLGESEGDHTIQVNAKHESGLISRSVIKFKLQRLANGQWSNYKIENGEPVFAIKSMPTKIFVKPSE